MCDLHTHTHTHTSVVLCFIVIFCIKAFGIVVCHAKNQFYSMVILFEMVIKDEPTALG